MNAIALTAPAVESGEANIETLLRACKRNGVFARGYAQILDVQAEIRRIAAEAEARRRPTEYLGRYRDAQDRLQHAIRRFLTLEAQNDAEIAFARRVARDLSG